MNKVDVLKTNIGQILYKTNKEKGLNADELIEISTKQLDEIMQYVEAFVFMEIEDAYTNGYLEGKKEVKD